MSHRVVVAGLGLVLASGALVACGAAKAAPPARASLTAATSATPASVTATGNGTASGPPDLLTIQVGVSTTLPHAQQTLQTNNAEAQQVINKLESDGVASKDIQTSQLTLNANYAGNPPHLVNYTATDIVTAMIHDLNRGGQIIDDAVAAGGNDAQLQSVQYSVQNDTALQAQARANAVNNATTEARAMAAAAGVSLGPVRVVSDTSTPVQVPYGVSYGAAGSAASGLPANVPAPVQAGSEIISAQVTVTYSLS